jgi:hypothetical protein
MRLVRFDIAALKRTKWHEYAIRFVFGGAITVMTGILAKKYGPVFGGLFLAFPAIFPASATLVQTHETEKKRRAGISFTARGRLAAALDARGAILGGFGLILFGLAMWRLLTIQVPLAFSAALVVWIGASVAIWFVRRPGFSSASKRHPRS